MKGAKDLVGREGTLKSAWDTVGRASIRQLIKLHENDKLASTLLSARETRPSFLIHKLVGGHEEDD